MIAFQQGLAGPGSGVLSERLVSLIRSRRAKSGSPDVTFSSASLSQIFYDLLNPDPCVQVVLAE